ncbi:MFS transporter [Pseudonocardia sp. ICBG601]|uniref:MFS transporter n=1 Tax=Pseudonocardia sp. ICBG601 TaxID=2846759 RepID=UPI001CF66480|nr:MFS transporter [Pseudonocardia sp. ICBG601]
MNEDQKPPRLSSAGLAAVLLAALLPMADSFIVNVALAEIDAELNPGPGSLELIVAGYVVAFTVLLVLCGRLGDIYGRKRVLMIGLTLFTLASLLCATAPTTQALIAARVAQGATAAMIPPQVLGTIATAVEEEHRPRAMSLFAVVSGLAAVIGLVLGGVLVHADLLGTSWRPIFLINLPIGIVAIALVLRYTPETLSPHPLHIDLRGTALLSSLILTLLIALNRGSWLFLLLLAIPPLALMLWRIEKKEPSPLLPPEVLTDSRVRRGLILIIPFLAVWAGYLFALPLALQQGFGLSPIEAAGIIAPMPITFILGSLTVPFLRSRNGDNTFSLGLIIQAVGVAWLIISLTLGAPIQNLLPGVSLIGLGQALAIGSSQISIIGAMPKGHAGTGGGVLVTTQQGSMAIGITVIGGLFTTGMLSSGHPTAFTAILIIQMVTLLVIAAASTQAGPFLVSERE